MTMAEKVLRFIAESPNGRRLGEISKFIYETNYPDEVGATRKTWRYSKTGKSIQCVVPAYRSYWGTNLTGNPSCAGILESFCIKTPDRRYVVVEPIKPPFFRRHGGKLPMTKTYEMNSYKRMYDYTLKKAVSPQCKNCGEACVYPDNDFFTPDGLAHHNMWSVGGWKADCKDRVWSGTYKTKGILTKLTKAQVTGMSECMRSKGAHSSLVEDTIQRFVLDNVVPL